jgi:hypothetical protein
MQRELFNFVLDEIGGAGGLINEALEISIDGSGFAIDRYTLPV